MGHQDPGPAVILEYPQNLAEQQFKIFDMLEKAAGVDDIDASVGEKGEPLFEVGDDICGRTRPAIPAALRSRVRPPPARDRPDAPRDRF